MGTNHATWIHPVATSANDLISNRIVATLAALAALLALALGGLALARGASGQGGSGSGRWPERPTEAMGLGLAATVAGLLVIATADGGLGTGNGVAGGVVAIVLGPMGAIVGGLARARNRRAA